ncbi:spore coat peptide assembly protein cotJB [Desulfotomaculum nigrificans CO-1-SRB]|uniref:Spore coat peptide assembly protein cotJB n=1 Tax=Desulfotomaculum nigrificans (strain DSM 14880 / VKM B-2319 / CO-1-SRB) TaxID=868595 RepID=F6B790_DESCC|nr:spore coat protein CotJB [Desulfotomaculum nigrificans]AEF93340.1 spore coat peptide assembly protein cotJB [Desulfotomaculum nigrificans CO-1-SRB]
MDTRQQAQMLLQIQQLEFAAVELNLFLDTHPDDQQALALYNQVHQQLMQCVQNYEQYYGPLLSYGFSPARQNTWVWAETPWPWEIKY